MLNEQQLNERENGLEPGPVSTWDKNQKWAVAGLAVFAVLIVVLWSVQLKNSIYGPLNGQSPTVAEQAQTNSLPAGEAGQTASDLALKNKDTDGDGLSDYDELNFHKTSPYLADSDGDGAKDGEEIKKGADPNCPLGRTCVNSNLNDSAGAPADSSSQNKVLDDLLNQFGAAGATGGSAKEPSSPAAGDGTGNLTAEQKRALEGIDAASLRQLLIEAGMDKQTLDQISDTDLMQSYSETLQ